MNLVLIGYRGTGKSTVGALLAERLGMRYVCMDNEIAQRAEMSIPEIVAQSGWQKFRDLESEFTKELTAQDGLIIDTGGGVIERQENVAVLRANARVFWLHASVASITSRIQGDSSRPALVAGKTFVEEIAEVMARRAPMYLAAAHYDIDANDATPDQVAENIIKIWAQRPKNSV
ncbi:MAG TPA: shikimate kinase [Desulfuromonadales bacterium]|nr:shikimate kinase [Desulfuromonadales bacterium]